jgi:hypothetical protein
MGQTVSRRNRNLAAGHKYPKPARFRRNMVADVHVTEFLGSTGGGMAACHSLPASCRP